MNPAARERVKREMVYQHLKQYAVKQDGSKWATVKLAMDNSRRKGATSG